MVIRSDQLDIFGAVQGDHDQQQNKSRVLLQLLFYRNVGLSLIVQICIPTAIHSRFTGCLPLKKSIIN
jgi:hypothetical protein